VEPEEMAVTWQRLGKHVPVATYIHTTIEELLDVAFPMWSVVSNIQYVGKEKQVISSSQNFLLLLGTHNCGHCCIHDGKKKLAGIILAGMNHSISPPTSSKTKNTTVYALLFN
jgi:hypothetical protein